MALQVAPVLLTRLGVCVILKPVVKQGAAIGQDDPPAFNAHRPPLERVAASETPDHAAGDRPIATLVADSWVLLAKDIAPAESCVQVNVDRWPVNAERCRFLDRFCARLVSAGQTELFSSSSFFGHLLGHLEAICGRCGREVRVSPLPKVFNSVLLAGEKHKQPSLNLREIRLYQFVA